MDLQHFITGTLESIAKGVDEAQKRVGDIAIVNPATTYFVKGQEYGHYKSVHGRPQEDFANVVHKIQFDVAVTAGGEATIEGGGEFKILLAKADMTGEGTYREESVSRVKFDVPMVLPADTREELFEDPPEEEDD